MNNCYYETVRRLLEVNLNPKTKKKNVCIIGNEIHIKSRKEQKNKNYKKKKDTFYFIDFADFRWAIFFQHFYQ